MISKKRHQALVRRVEQLEKQLREQKYRHERLLEHLGLKELVISPKSEQTKIVTKKEWEKANEKEAAQRQRLFQTLSNQTLGFPLKSGLR
jgi:glutamyl-tRNA reductase